MNIEMLKPRNRHITVVPHFTEAKTDNGVLLPDDYNPERTRYIEATVVDVAPDCSEHFKSIKYGTTVQSKILIDSSMLQEVNLRGKRIHLILENYVLGIFGRPEGL